MIEFRVLGSLLVEDIPIKPNKNHVEINQDSIFEGLLKKYFRLDFNLLNHYATWSEKDELFKAACKQFYGIRMLAQEPVENLFSFICSQNNHISRWVTSLPLCTRSISRRSDWCHRAGHVGLGRLYTALRQGSFLSFQILLWTI